MSEGLLQGKTALVAGVANKRSIAWAIAQKLHEQGATLAFTYQGERLEGGVRKLAESVGSTVVVDCDVSDDESIERAPWRRSATVLGKLDSSCTPSPTHHPMRSRTASSRRRARRSHRPRHLCLLDDRDGPRGRAADERRRRDGEPHLHGERARVPGVQHDGAWPRPRSRPACATSPTSSARAGIRVNAISAGPVRTLAAKGIKDFDQMTDDHREPRAAWSATSTPRTSARCRALPHQPAVADGDRHGAVRRFRLPRDGDVTG